MKIRLCNLIGKIRKYHFRSVFFVNFIMILSMILAFVIVAGGIFVFFNMKNIEDEYTNNAINDSKRVADTLNEYITDARKTVANFIIDADVVWFMSNYDGINSDVMLENRIISKMYSNRNFASYIESIYIYSAQKKCVISEEGVYSTDRFADMGWVVNEDLAEQKRIMIVPRVYNENNLLTVVGKYKVGGINKGNVVVNINVSMMRDEILKKFPQIRARISDQGIVIFSTVVEEFMQQSEYVADNSEKRAVIDGKTYIECTYNLGGTKDVNLETVIWIPLKNYNDIQKNMTVSSLVFIFIFILFGVGISVIFAGYTSTPISNLNDLLEKYEKQEVDREYKEIDNITRIIMNLIDDNELLKSELDRKMTEYKRLELVLLQGQINPHYINNTLGAISLDAGMKYGFDNNVIKMLNVLSSSLRYSFASNKISTMINNEVQFLNEYITIMNYCYPSISINMFVDEKVSEYKILKVCIQPLIENSVFHGLRNKGENGRVDVYIRSEYEEIIVEVCDNGVGMSQEKLDELIKYINNADTEEGKSIGLKNVFKRFKLFYGNKFSFDVKSGKNEGTRVIIRYPKTL